MITQVIAISMVLLSIRWQALNGFAMLWMWGVVVFGIASAIEYFRKFWRKVDSSIKHRRRQGAVAHRASAQADAARASAAEDGKDGPGAVAPHAARSVALFRRRDNLEIVGREQHDQHLPARSQRSEQLSV